jgi:hypothetical protein
VACGMTWQRGRKRQSIYYPMLTRTLVDVHTHVYLPRYASLLRSRTSAPRIVSRAVSPGGAMEERLLILDDEPSGGRPVGPQVCDPFPSMHSENRCGCAVLGQR